jgi:SAM-dependent methyltransferase
VGIDPSLGAVLAARRVAQQMGVEAEFVVGDARFLPFKDGAFDVGFSYSVLQHFAKVEAEVAVRELKRVLRPDGQALVQMPNRLGIRCLLHQFRRGFHEGAGFDVRYWSLRELRKWGELWKGEIEFSVDCFFGIGLQLSDAALMPIQRRWILIASEILRRWSRYLPALIYLADSVYICCRRSSTERE